MCVLVIDFPIETVHTINNNNNNSSNGNNKKRKQEKHMAVCCIYMLGILAAGGMNELY